MLLRSFPDPHGRSTLRIIFRHAQICLRSIFSILFVMGSSDVAAGYQSTVATCQM